MNLKELFDYRDGELFNRISRGPRAVKGSRAGNVNPSNGYWRIGIDGKIYQLSRIVWMWHHGEIPNGLQIDHIDGNCLNNRIENLRLVTHLQNEWNKPRCGVNYEKGKWRARMQHEGNSVHIGCFPTQEQAIHAYTKTVEPIRGEYLRRAA